MRYVLNNELFLQRLRSGGFKGVQDFARRSGLHRNTVNLYLKGREVFADAFARMAAALGCDPTDLAMPVSDADIPVKGVGEIRPIIAALVKRDAGIAVVLIGSRAGKRHHPHADWDIGITGGERPLDDERHLEMKRIVGELADDLPHHVDVVNLDAAPRWFLDGIDCDPVFLDGDRGSFLHFKGVLDGIKRTAA